MSNRDSLNVQWLGLVDYDEAWALQKTLVAAGGRDVHQDRLLLLEHPATFTLGRRGQTDNLIYDESTLRREGIAVRYVDRGGDITYHGPGQLVGYPILDLRRLYARRGYQRPDLHLYLREIEEVLILVLKAFGIDGWRYEGYTGVWVDGAEGPLKIAAIGIKVSSKGISSHGFALNVAPNLDHFKGIVPCGIEEHGVTSMAHMLPQAPAVADVLAPTVEAFSRVFQVDARFVTGQRSA